MTARDGVNRLLRTAWLRRAGPGTANANGLLSPGLLVRGLSRATRARAADRLERLSCFDASDYVALNPDVGTAQVRPATHALLSGSSEGRVLFRPERLARALGAVVRQPAPQPDGVAAAGVNRFGPTPTVALYVSSRGNVFMRDIAADIAAVLAAAGVAVRVLDETTAMTERPALGIVVAPHEFFVLGSGRRWLREDFVASSFMLNTEQPQTEWFATALPLLLAGRGVIDLCPQLATMFAAAGVPALHLTPVPPVLDGPVSERDREHPLFRILPSAAKVPAAAETPYDRRPLEIAFFGTETPHREAWLARNAGWLAGHDTFLHVRRMERGPIRADLQEGALSRLARHVCGHSRIMLNLHRDEYGYFEWHRIVRLGLCAGAVVVSEPCLPHPDLLADQHYFSVSARQMPNLLDWLLRTDDGRARARRMQCDAAAHLAGALTAARMATQLLGFLHQPVAAR